MNIYETPTIGERIKGNPYVGRGVIIGRTEDATRAVLAYFIMGRSNNSRNRVFTEKEDSLFTEPFDCSLVEDPSLIIYAALRRVGKKIVVTNGDQTDTVADALRNGGTFESALETREFEPDAPNFTPRISGILNLDGADFTYKMSILKSADAAGSACARFTYSYPSLAGVGHFIHTYVTDGNPIPTFQGEPERIAIPNDIDVFTRDIWDNLNEDNRISLYVRTVDLATGKEESRMINKNGAN